MKTSQLLLATLREAPADAEIISHKLMLRAGMVRQLTRGIYTWLPLGLRVLRKIESIVRDEMDASGAQEVLMPAIQPAGLWRESGRWEQYGPELLRLTDRHDREFCFGPTHEEIITDLVRLEINSYKQLPANFYQIQTKFRDEVRPRFGIMRAREFLMKDAYSFHLTQASMERTYEDMHRAYSNIFTRLGLKFRAVMADSGNIGGNRSHEFHVLAESGEDQIVFTEDGDYAANLEQAEAMKPTAKMPVATATMATISTPGRNSIAEVSEFLRVQPQHCLKTLIVEAENGGLIALVLRGDHELNQIKAEKLPGVKAPLVFAEESAIRQAIGCGTGAIGPVGLSIPMYVDHCAAVLTDFVCGANQDDIHLTGVNWERDVPVPKSVDIRNVCEGDMAIDGSGPLRFARGIEVGHIFQLGDKYSASLNTTCLDKQGKAVTLLMGCYGIGVSRIVAASIEQNHDDRGICWSAAIAPFSLALVPINMHKSQRLREAVTQLYEKFLAAGMDVILDDRKERPGVMFADMELIGIPHRIVFSERGLDSGMLEYKSRRNDTSQDIPLASAVEAIQQLTDNES